MTDDAPQQTAQHTQEGTRHTLEITLPADAMLERVNAAAAAYRERVRLPGFRQGKAPLSMVRAQYADDIRQHVLDHAIPEALGHELRERDLTPLESPELASVEFRAGSDLQFVVSFDTAPVVELHDTEVSGTRPAVVVTEEMIDEALDQLRDRAGQLVPVEAGQGAAEGMYARCRIELLPNDGRGKKLAEEHRFVGVGNEKAIPGLNDRLPGMTEGASDEFVTELAASYPNAILAGKEVLCRFEVTELKQRVVPEVDDDLAKELGFDDLAALRDHARADLGANLEVRAERALESALLEQLRAKNPVDVPESQVERRLDDFSQRFARELMGQGIDARDAVDWEAFRAENRPGAIAALADEMLLDRLADDQSIEVADAVVNEEIDRQLSASEGGKSRPVASVVQQMRKDGSYDGLRRTMRRRLALDHLKAHATIDSESGEETPADGP